MHTIRLLVVAVAAATIFSLGCTSLYNKPMDEIVRHQHYRESGMHIQGFAGLQDTVIFDRFGGTYVPDSSRIVGISNRGETLSVGLADITTLYITPTKAPWEPNLDLDSLQLKREYRPVRPEAIHSLSLSDGRFVSFGLDKGRTNCARRVIEYQLPGGRVAEYSWADIATARVKRLNSGRTVMLIGGLAMTALVIYMAQQPFFSGGWSPFGGPTGY